jgi:hypothetical protein
MVNIEPSKNCNPQNIALQVIKIDGTTLRNVGNSNSGKAEGLSLTIQGSISDYHPVVQVKLINSIFRDLHQSK